MHRPLITLLAGLLLAAAATAQSTKPESRPQEKIAYVLMETSMGNIVLALNRQKAPITVENFLSYVDKEFYDGVIFHRVMPNFMIQAGGFTPDMKEKKTDANIKNEWRNGLKNKRGAVAMARLGGQPDSASSQFFINVKDNFFLDKAQRDGAAYAVFGEVVAGLDVVDKIRVVPTTTKSRHQNVPVEPVMIKRVGSISAEEASNHIKSGSTTKPG